MTKLTQETEDVVGRLAETLIADGSSDLRPDYLAAALNVCLSKCELVLMPQSLSDRIDVLREAGETLYFRASQHEGFGADERNFAAMEAWRSSLIKEGGR